MSFAALQKAIYTALVSEPALVALVPAARVVDDVPHQKEGGAPAFPYITIGDQSGREESADDVDISAFQVSLHVWSRAAGRSQCLQIMDAMRKALSWSKDYALEFGALVDIAYAGHETQRDADGETYHGIVRFEGLLQFG